MTVMVDDRPLAAAELGIRTLGQLLAHVQKDNRLVVHVLIDGKEPDLDRLGTLRGVPLNGHTLFIETTEPRVMALEVLDEVEEHLGEADRLSAAAVSLLRSNQTAKALEKLRGCFSLWQHAQESVQKTAQLLRIDLSRITAGGRPFTDVLGQFTQQLRLIKLSLEHRDFVSLADTLVYEVGETSGHWRGAIKTMRTVVAA